MLSRSAVIRAVRGLLLVGMALGTLCVCGPAASAAETNAVSSTVSSTVLCQAAGVMISHGQLTAAEKLLVSGCGAATAPDCVVQGLDQVAASRKAAQALADSGTTAFKAGKLDKAEADFQVALAADDANKEAIAGEAKIAAAPQGIVRSANSWDEWYRNYVAPAGRLILPFLATMLFLVVVMRLITSSLVRNEANEWNRWVRRSLTGLGWLLIAYASALVTIQVSAETAPSKRTLTGSSSAFLSASSPLVDRIVVASVSAAVGVVLLALLGGRGLRLQIQAHKADGSTDGVATAYAIARLRALGSTVPRGLEVPQQTDVTQLPEGALSSLPQGQLAAALFSLARAVLPQVPWRAEVTVSTDERVVVSLSRNGRLFDSAVVSAHVLGLSSWALVTGKPDVDTKTGAAAEEDDSTLPSQSQVLSAVAAFLLVQLSKRHGRLRPGLCGATRWQSVALQVLADMRASEPDAHKALLAQALSFDPNNAVARVAYIHVVGGRHEAAASRQRRFATLMSAEYQRIFKDGVTPDGFEVLELRMLYSIAAALLNVSLLGDMTLFEGMTPANGAAARVDDLIRRLKVPRHGEIGEFVKTMQPSAAMLWQGAAGGGGLLPYPDETVEGWAMSRSLAGPALYDRACVRAQLPATFEDALNDLELVCGLDGYRLTARTDPSFQQLRDAGSQPQRTKFKQIVADPAPQRFIDLPPFVDSASKLAAAGITQAPQLLQETRWRRGKKALAGYLEISPLVIDHWRQLAELSGAHPDLEQPVVLDLLVAEGITSRELLAERARDLTGLVAALKAASYGRQLDPPAATAISRWLG